jgi:O-antigen ligase
LRLLAAILMAVVVVIVGEAMARSRAGLILTIVALAGVFVLAAADQRNATERSPNKVLLAAIMLGIIFAVQFALYRFLDRFMGNPLLDARIPFALNTLRAGLAFFPFGAGLGTFVPVYGLFERPTDLFADTYANHAHNDILELWLEIGMMGLALGGLFVVWLCSHSVKLWRRSLTNMRGLDCLIARVATIVLGLLIAHSLVDYALRTEAMLTVFALCCALLIEPLRNADDELNVAEDAFGRTPRKHRSSEAAAVLRPSGSLAADSAGTKKGPQTPKLHSGERWGEGIIWPEEWRKVTQQKGPGGNWFRKG